MALEKEKELKALRDLREVNLAIKSLENQQQRVSRRFKRGIRMLQNEALTVEGFIDVGTSGIDGTEPWNTRGEKLSDLINVPVLTNIPEDTNV
jgi:hypothetical protein